MHDREAGGRPVFPPLGPIALFLAAAFGPLVLVVGSHNWWYGVLLPQRAGELIHLVHGLLLLLGPAAAWWFVGFDLRLLFNSSVEPAQLVAGGYVMLCW